MTVAHRSRRLRHVAEGVGVLLVAARVASAQEVLNISQVPPAIRIHGALAGDNLGTSAKGPLVGELSGDGIPDLVFSYTRSNGPSIFKNV